MNGTISFAVIRSGRLQMQLADECRAQAVSLIAIAASTTLVK